MAKIDLEKWICSMIEAFPDFKKRGKIPCMYEQALKDQGLEYKDGQIVETEYRCTGIGIPKEEEGVLKEMIDEPLEIKADQWHETKDYTSIDPHFGKSIDIPFGAYNSELIYNEWTIPEGYTAEVKDDKIIIRKTESEDERMRKAIHIYLDWLDGRSKDYLPKGKYTIREMIAWLEKQKLVE